MDDFEGVQIVHATGNLFSPVQHQGGWDFLAISEYLVELTIGAVLHDDTIAGSLGANTPRGLGGETETN